MDASIQIDVSDKLDPEKYYYLENIKVDYGDYRKSVAYISYNDYASFKEKVENILDATIVNSKQRESLQKLLDNAFYDSSRFDCML